MQREQQLAILAFTIVPSYFLSAAADNQPVVTLVMSALTPVRVGFLRLSHDINY